MSRYPPPDSGGDSRRSPHRDRSPPRYNDGPDRAPFNGAPRENNYRPATDGRNANNFPPRENYRESGRDLINNFQPREPPRGPKASLGDKPPLSDIPSGPRGNSFSHEAPSSYRGGFGGPPRRGGAEYRNTSRDRAPPPVRDLDRDFRERRENRGPPSPERFGNNVPDRDFDDRNRFDRRESNYRGDSFRGRGDSFRGRGRGRAISPRGRERSPPLRDDRGPPLRSRGGGAWQPRGGGGYRGRGGGRGGYFSDSRSDVGVGRRRSRSPDREPFRPYNRRPDEVEVKPPPLRPYSSVGISAPRENPSPPPQAPEVPAFGTVVQNNIPNGPAGQGQHSMPATPVAIPTGPRSERTQPFQQRELREPFQRGTTIRTETELIWTANNHSAAPPNGPRSIAAPSQSPVELFQQRRPQSMEPGYGRGGYGYQRSPQLQSRPASRDSGAGVRRQESIDRDKQGQDLNVHMMEAGEVDETPIAQRGPTPPPPKKVETITLVRRPTGVDMSFLDMQSDSDLEDDLGPEYFEKEIEAVKQEIKEASLNNATEENIFHYEFLVANYTDELRAPIIPAPLPPIVPPKAEVVTKSPEVAIEKTDATTPMQLDDIPPAPSTSAAQPTPSSEMGGEQSTAAGKTPELATPSNELAELAISPNNKSPPKSKLSLALPDEELDEQSVEEEAQILEVVHKRMATPPMDTLPFRPLTPPEDIEMYDIDNLDDVMEYLVDELVAKDEQRQKDIKEQQIAYKKFYKDWILFHHSNNEMAVKVRQKWEANRAAEVSRAASVAPEKDNKPEGRSRGRFATEHDMERILKLSEVEAREARARSDRAAKAKLANEKEAVIPDMLSPEERKNDKYGDYTNRVSPERALAVFQVLPPIPDFTDQERNIFEATMLEYPKQWGKIANQLPGRNYKHVIQYYYLVKHELKLKEKLKKGLKGRRRKRVAKTSVHTVALGRDEDPDDPPPVIEEGGTRRRPKRAAAPTFGAGSGANANANAEFAGPSESEGATPVPTSRRGGGTPKGEANGDAPTTGRRKGKQAKERAPKQAKNTQLLAAATSNDAQRKNREETKVPAPIPMQEWKISRQGPPEPEQISFQQQIHQVGGYDGGDMRPQRTATHTPPNPMIDRPPPALAPYEAPPQYGVQEPRNPIPMNAYDQQTQRSMAANNSGAPTSSYWSVSEAESFPALLKHFGTDWHGIAKWMASKTHIMVYTNAFQDWLTVPSDSNKSRRVANLAEQVKNYYQRQVDQGGKPGWEVIAREADEKKARGESTGPPPMPSHNPVKRKYDGLPGDSPSRGPMGTSGGMNPEELEEMWGNGPTQQQPPLKFGGMPGTGRFDSFTQLPSRAGTLGTFELPVDTKRHQHSIAHDPSPGPAQRFQPLAQAGQMPESRAVPQAKIMPQQGQGHMGQQMQQQPGPQRGYFNVSQDRRPILHARSSHNSVASHGSPHPESSAHRSQAAKAMEEAHAEQQRAQRLIEDQAEAERIRMGQQQQQGQMAGRMPMKQEPDGQHGLPPHLSPHVRDLRDFQGEPMQGVQQGIPQHRMGQRHDGGSQPISPMRPEDRRPVQQPSMPGYSQPFRGPQHPGQPPQQIQSQRDPRMESKMGITTGPSTPIIAAHAPIQGPQMGMREQGMRGSTMSAPPGVQQQQGGPQPHVHAHHHHVHQHVHQQRHSSQQGPGQPILQDQPSGLGPQHQAQHQGQMAQMHQQGPPPQPRSEAAPARKSNLFSLLNNDDEPAPKTPALKSVPSPLPFSQGQGYAPSRMSTAGPPQMGPGPRDQQHMLRRETSHSDIRQSQDLRGQGPPPQEMRPGQQMRPGVQRRDTMPPQGFEGERQRVPNPQAQQNLVPQQARSHAGSHAGSPMEGPREVMDGPLAGGIDRSRLVKDERGMIRGEIGPPRDVRDSRDAHNPIIPRDIGRDARDIPRDLRDDPRAPDARMRGPPVDDREREREFYYRQEEERRRQMMIQRQEAEMQQRQGQQPHPGHPSSHGSQSAVNSPQLVAYQPHLSQMGQAPPTGSIGQSGPPQQSHRAGMFGTREQLGHGSRHSSFDGRDRQMLPGVVASQGPPPTSGYVTSHPGEQRGFPPQQGPPPPQSAPPRFEQGQAGPLQGPQGPERGVSGAPRQGDGRQGDRPGEMGGRQVVNAKAVANNQYAPVYATQEQVDAQRDRERRQVEARARGEPVPPNLDARDMRDQRGIDRRDRDLRAMEQQLMDPRGAERFDPKDPRSMQAQPPRDPRDIPRDLRDERSLNDPRDPRLVAPPRDSPRSYVPNPMAPQDHRGVPQQEMNRPPPPGLTPSGLSSFGAFGASAEEMRERERLLQRERAAEEMREREMRERERLLQREREAEIEVERRLGREGGGPFSRR